jgi:hypothetical protein
MVSDRRTLGERWKRQRERRGVSLESISTKTKIPVSLFAGLERGDCSRWPAGLYSRAYVRAYADAIGVSGEEAVEDFVAAFGGGLPGEGIQGSLSRSRAAGHLRLSMVEEPDAELGKAARRVAFATVDLAIALLIAWIAHRWLGTGVWLTVAAALVYPALGRMISDEPLLVWMFKSSGPVPTPEEEAAEVAAVGDAASTTA